MSEIGIGVVGLGFMGRQHAINAAMLGRSGVGCRLVSVCSRGVRSADDLRGSDGSGNIEGAHGSWPTDVTPQIVERVEDLFRDPEIDLVVVSTPTPTHAEMASAALRAGKHVLVEKPVALRAEGVSALRRVVESCPEQLCMPAHVMRFWPGWAELAAWIADGRYGRVRSATFRRLGSMPTWNTGFYGDVGESGGALTDLHVHDVDFILWCFGVPSGVHVSGSAHHMTGCYTFEEGPEHVTAEGAWDRQPGAGFTMQYAVEFERATVEFELGRPMRVVMGDDVDEIELPGSDGYANELRALVEAIAEGRPAPVTLEDAERAARVIDIERDLLSGG